MDNAASLRWITKSGRSKRPRPEWRDDEYDAALSLLLLSESGGGFCNSTTADPTISPPKPHQEIAATPSPLIIKIKRQKKASPDTPLLPPPAFACSMCDRVFECSQVLGGHMTVHRAKKGKAAVAVVDHHHNSARVHECLICHETFDMGQALGGHKRKHFDKSKPSRKGGGGGGSSASSGGESSASTGGARPMLMIDLNLPAPPE